MSKIELSQFETEAIGKPVFRVVSVTDEQSLESEISTCHGHLIAKLPMGDISKIKLLTRSGFQVCCASSAMCIGQLERLPALAKTVPKASVRIFVEEDLGPAYSIIDEAFQKENRYTDDIFLRPYSNAIHRAWLLNSVNGYAQYTVAAEVDGKVAGLGTLHVNQRTASIGLLAVDPRFRRKGVAAAITRNLLSRSIKSNCTELCIVTESCNTNALNFYISEGFRHTGAEISLYKQVMQ
jgi:ribosomal protein S18 acetylase RimI-like enzyme